MQTEIEKLKAHSAKIAQKISKIENFINSRNPSLNAKAIINCPGPCGKTLFHYAVEIGDFEVVQAWVKSGLVDLEFATQQRKEKLTPMQIALRKGYVEIAELLFQSGALCESIELSSAKGDCYQWFSNKLIESLNQEVVNARGKNIYSGFFSFQQSKCPQIFNKNTNCLTLAQRAAELGDLNFIKQCGKHFGVDKALNLAAANGRIEVVNYLLEVCNCTAKYKEDALLKAVCNQQYEVVDYFLNKKVSINGFGTHHLKNTPLIAAINTADEKMLALLFSKGALRTPITDVYGNTFLHYAFKKYTLNQIVFLLKHLSKEEALNLLFAENIFGQKPLECITDSQQPHEILDFLKKEFQPEALPPINNDLCTNLKIDQSHLIRKFWYYLRLNNRDLGYLSLYGLCNGLGFIFLSMASSGHTELYYEIVACIMRWNEEGASLYEKLPDNITTFYFDIRKIHVTTLFHLFEQVVNESIWFQNSELYGEDKIFPKVKSEEDSDENELLIKLNKAKLILKQQEDRTAQYQMITNKESQPLFFIYNDYNIFSSRSEAQVKEFLFYGCRLPGICIEISGGRHLTVVFIDAKQQKKIIYYDPNQELKIKTFDANQSDVLTKIILDTKYTALCQPSHDILFNLYYFLQSDSDNVLETFELFTENEYPINPEAAQKFRENSANKNTPLHLAVTFRNQPSLTRLLTDGFCDINEKNAEFKTAFDICIEQNNPSHAVLLIQACNDKSPWDKMACKAYQAGMHDVLDAILSKHNLAMNFKKLLIEAINQKDRVLINKLIENKKVNLFAEGADSLPLITVMGHNDVELFQYLLANGAKVTAAFVKPSDQSQVDKFPEFIQLLGLTPLKLAIEYMDAEDVILLNCLNALPTIDSLDVLGNTALFYAVYFKKTDIIVKILQNGANVFSENNLLKNKFSKTPIYTPISLFLENSTKFSKEDCKNIIIAMLSTKQIDPNHQNTHEVYLSAFKEMSKKNQDEELMDFILRYEDELYYEKEKNSFCVIS